MADLRRLILEYFVRNKIEYVKNHLAVFTDSELINFASFINETYKNIQPIVSFRIKDGKYEVIKDNKIGGD